MITIGYCSKEHDEKFYEYINSYFNGEAYIIEKIAGTHIGKTISKCYNEILAESVTDVVVFVHNNVEFVETEKYKLRVDKCIEYQFDNNIDYGILGIAPRCRNESDIVVRNYAPFEFYYSECDANGYNQTLFSAGKIKPFSMDISRDSFIDGVFMAVKKSRLKSWFNEENESFEFYDLDLCIGNLINGVKVGITKGFHVLHYASRNGNDAWNSYFSKKEAFVSRWSKYLPFYDEQNRISLLILTPSCRFDNLLSVAHSIEDNFRHINNVDVYWAVCYDKYNGVGDLDKFYETAKNMAFSLFLIPSGKEGQKNYGGDILNDGLSYVKENYLQNIDPWVYILDDDNLICPLMAHQIESMVSTANSIGKSAIWMSMSREDGFIDTIRRYSIYGKGKNNDVTYADEFMPDPSELLLKYSKIEEFGFFSPGYEYDQDIWEYFYFHDNDVLLPEDWHPGHWGIRGSNNFFQCFHDGKTDEETTDSIKESIKSNEPISYVLTVGRNERADRIVLKKSQGMRVFDDAVKRSKYKYSVLTCIFNGYESLKDIKDKKDDVEYVCVTDNENLKSDSWKIILAGDFFDKLPGPDKYLYIRYHPFQFVESDICITMDASLEILTDLYDGLIVPFIDGNYYYGVTLHYENDTVKDEIEAWNVLRGFKEGDYDRINEVIGGEIEEMHGVLDSGFIIHKDTRECYKINEMAWEFLHAVSTDNTVERNNQGCLSYVLNKYFKDDERIMFVHPFIFEGNYLKRWTHNGNYWIVYDSKNTCKSTFWNHNVDAILLDM